MLAWRALHDVEQGPVFIGVNRWGDIGEKATLPNMVTRWLRDIMTRAGLESEGYSSHSMRRGFATFADSQGVAAGKLAKWVEWKSLQTAEGYIDRAEPLPVILARGLSAPGSKPKE